jgi:hypothetical protein
VLWKDKGYREKETPAPQRRGVALSLCSATSGAGILKTQVFKKPCKGYFAKKNTRSYPQKKGICANKKKSAENIPQKIFAKKEKPLLKKSNTV